MTDASVTASTRLAASFRSSLQMAPRLNTRSRPFFRGSRGSSSFRGQRGRGRGGSSATRSDAIPKQDDEGTRLAERFEQVKAHDEIDDKLGFFRVQEGLKKEGWLVNMHPVECRFSFSRSAATMRPINSWKSTSEPISSTSSSLIMRVLTDLTLDDRERPRLAWR